MGREPNFLGDQMPINSKTLTSLVFDGVGKDWTHTAAVKGYIVGVNPEVRESSIVRTLNRLAANEVLEKKPNPDNHRLSMFRRLVPTIVVEEIKPRPRPKRRRAAGRPIEKPRPVETVPMERPLADRLPKNTVRVTHNCRDWRDPKDPILPVRYCETADGNLYRIKRDPEDRIGYASVTKAHVLYMAEERIWV